MWATTSERVFSGHTSYNCFSVLFFLFSFDFGSAFRIKLIKLNQCQWRSSFDFNLKYKFERHCMVYAQTKTEKYQNIKINNNNKKPYRNDTVKVCIVLCAYGPVISFRLNAKIRCGWNNIYPSWKQKQNFTNWVQQASGQACVINVYFIHCDDHDDDKIDNRMPQNSEYAVSLSKNLIPINFYEFERATVAHISRASYAWKVKANRN